MAVNSDDKTEGTCDARTDAHVPNKHTNEYKKKKILQIRSATSVYIAKLIGLLFVATVALFTASDIPALLLGCFTFAVAIMFDMLILAKDNPVSDIWWIILVQWFITIIFGLATATDLVVLLIYNIFSDETQLLLKPIIRVAASSCMYIMGIIGPLIEIYYNIPYDD